MAPGESGVDGPKTCPIIVGVILAILVLALVGSPTLLSHVAEEPAAAARAALVERGHVAEDLVLLSVVSASPIFSSDNATVSFSSAAANEREPETIQVELRRPVFSAEWQVLRIRPE